MARQYTAIITSASWNGKHWINDTTRERIYARDDHRCAYCGCDLREAGKGIRSLDHLTSRDDGGNNDPRNLITSCRPCNTKRGKQSWRDFLQESFTDEADHRIARICYRRYKKLPRN